MRPNGSPAVLEVRRRHAMSLLDEGFGVREVARQMKCSPASVSRWQTEVKARGPDALRPKPVPGRPSLLSTKQRARLLKMMLKGAGTYGFSTDLWTLRRVAELIERTFGVRYHPAHVWKVLRGEGWSCQKPEQRARERDEEAIEKWRTERWPHIKKRQPSRQKRGLSR
jgi:transposase